MAPAGHPRDDSGFSILETIIALSLFALVIIGLVTSANAGLRLTSTSNGRQQASQAATEVIEGARTFSFDAVALPTATGYETTPGSPDLDVTGSAGARKYKPQMLNGLQEDLVETAAGGIAHKQPIQVGSRTIQTYSYVTWIGANQAQKRLTVVAVWPEVDQQTGVPRRVALSAIFSRGKIDNPATTLATAIGPHSVGQVITLQVTSIVEFPTAPPSFSVIIDGETFTVTSTSGMNFTATAGGTIGHAAGSPVTLGSSAGSSTTTSSSTTTTSTTTTTAGGSCPGDTTPPTVTSFAILQGSAADSSAGFTNSSTLTVTANATDTCAPLTMELSNSATFTGAYLPYSTSTPWAATAGDGVKTVYARFRDGQGNVSATRTATVTVDTTPPSTAPSKFSVSRSKSGTEASISFDGDTTDTNFNGYRVFRQTGSTGPFTAQSAEPSCNNGGKCTWDEPSGSLNAGTGYTYYVVGVDKAGNYGPKTANESI